MKKGYRTTGYLGLTVLCLLSMAFHPLHVSICEIDHDQKRNTLEITARVFVDDLEAEIRSETGISDLDIIYDLDQEKRDLQLQQYFEKHLVVSLSGRESSIKYLGSEEESGAMFCYLEIANVEALGNIRVKYDVLLDFYDDQVNLVHISQGDKVKSLKMDPGTPEGEMDF